jgi:hypothetical protein
MMFLSQRPEPQIKPLSEEIKKKRKSLTSNDVRLQHTAGGYDHANNDRRNWTEIYSQIKLT